MEFLANIADQVMFCVQNVWTQSYDHFAGMPIWVSLIVCFPLVAFIEVPRYTFPAVLLILRHFFWRPYDDHQEKQNFMDRKPSVSILLVGLNEEATIEKAINALLEFNYPNMEIIVVDDNSTDRMYEKALPYALRGQIRLFKNSAASGRGGRPAASNTAFALAKGEYILSVDADTAFNHTLLTEMIGSFYDPTVGVVAANLKVLNSRENFLTRMQTLEYLQSISLWKSWLTLLGWNMQASGACGALRREALLAAGGWNAELGEDADISLQANRSGWRTQFCIHAHSVTKVPSTWKSLIKQRYRWDRGTVRTYYQKHGDMAKFWEYGWENAGEIILEYFTSVVLGVIYPIWLVGMLLYDPFFLVAIVFICYFFYAFSAMLSTTAALLISHAPAAEWTAVVDGLWFPFYKSVFRWVRIYSTVLSVLRINYEDSYMPQTAWRNAPRW